MPNDKSASAVPEEHAVQTADESAVDSPKRRLSLVYWLPAALFAGGLVAGAASITFRESDPTTSDGIPNPEQAATSDAESTDVVDTALNRLQTENSSASLSIAGAVDSSAADALADAIQRGDDALRGSNVLAALASYSQIAGSVDVPPDDVLYRVALCRETLGQRDQAHDLFRRITQGGGDDGLRDAALLGQARTWSMNGRSEQGHSLLARRILGEVRTGRGADTILGELLFEFAFELSGSLFESAPSVRLLDDAAIVTRRDPLPPEKLLDLIVGRAESDTNATERQSTVNVTQRLGSNPEAIWLDVRQEPMPLASLLALLGECCELQIDYSHQANQVARTQSVSADIHIISLAGLLDLILVSRDFAWSESEAGVRIMLRHEVDPEHFERHRSSIAERALRRALSRFPDHRLAPYGYRILGDLNFARGQLDQAIAHYLQVQDGSTEVPHRAAVVFNLAKSQLALGRRDAARDAFLRVIDTGVTGDLAAVSRLYVGRLDLERGEAKLAARSLMRATHLASQAGIRAVAALTLATAWLMEGMPATAHEVLAKHRTDLLKSGYRTPTAFLSALARYRGSIEPALRRQNSQVLIASLARVRPEDFFGHHTSALLAEVFREFELQEQQRRALELGTRTITAGPLHEEMQLELADCLINSQQTDDARGLLDSLLESDVAGHRLRAATRIAQLSLDAGDHPSCISLCRSMIPDLSDSERPILFRLLGKAYERSGQHGKASHCFAGMLPNDDSANEQQDLSI